MAMSTRLFWRQCFRQSPLSRSAPRRHSSIAAQLQHDLTRRKIQPTFEDLTPQTSYRLDTTLADFLPATNPPPVLPSTLHRLELPIPHHLCYFEPSKRASEMLPDGTNPDQSPGGQFTRRMWAGGRVHYNRRNPLRLDGSRGVCAEFIRSVMVKGKEGEEKVFVSIERRLAQADVFENTRLVTVGRDTQKRENLDHYVRQRLWRDEETDFGECSVVETRNIVFMRPHTAPSPLSPPPPPKILKPSHEATYSHTIHPDAKLLFRFSALTFNAHAIHLDPSFCQNVEGHRDLLFHGPLSLVFLAKLLVQQLPRGEELQSIEYRNLAPLYCNEPVTFCGARTGQRKWEVWALTPEGGMAVKGTATTG